MNMKTRLMTGVLVLISGVALADGPPPGAPGHGPGPGPGMSIDKLEVLLDLDAYQKQEVQKILDEQHAAMRAKREQMRNSQTRPSFQEMEAQRATAQKETRAKLAKILSDQQMKKFDVLTERPPMRPRGDHRNRGGNPSDTNGNGSASQ
jgi:hypothetical protein